MAPVNTVEMPSGARVQGAPAYPGLDYQDAP